jgi:hypothetical protein
VADLVDELDGHQQQPNEQDNENDFDDAEHARSLPDNAEASSQLLVERCHLLLAGVVN